MLLYVFKVIKGAIVENWLVSQYIVSLLKKKKSLLKLFTSEYYIIRTALKNLDLALVHFSLFSNSDIVILQRT